jgi:hypothetical protein
MDSLSNTAFDKATYLSVDLEEEEEEEEEQKGPKSHNELNLKATKHYFF